MRTPIALLAALVMTVALIAPLGADEHENAEDPRFPTDVTVVGSTIAGTFGDSDEEAALGHELGADLLEARIHMPDPEHVEFVIDLTNLPPIGGTPEVIRYTWDMFIDTGDGPVEAQLDGKFTNYSRGVCDPTAGCDPTEGDMPEDPGMAPFFFRGNLTVLDVGVNFNAMDNLATIEADFDVDESTITVLVPVEVIDLLDGVEFGDCSEIRPGDGLRGGTVETSLAAWITSDSFPHDMIFGFNTFTAPHALDAEVDCAGEPIEPVEP